MDYQLVDSNESKNQILKPFKMEKGLRQGDPLSLYLFILVTEVLAFFLNKAINLHLIEPLFIGKDKNSADYGWANELAAKVGCVQRRFFWGESSDGNMGVPVVKWSSIELPKHLGGLGVGNILMKNLILLFKWWWRYSASDLPLWKRILSSVYSIRGLKTSSYAFSRVRDGMWYQLLSNDDLTTRVRTIVEDGMILKVGNGQSILFWLDRWCESGPFYRAFPRLFALSLQSNYFINQMGEWVENSWVWNLRWRRALYEWESAEVGSLEICIGRYAPSRIDRDGISWKNNGLISFPTKCITEKVYESSMPILPKSITQLVWRSCNPPRVRLTLWLACLKKLKTGDILVDKGIVSIQNSHLLFSCSFSWCVWMEILRWWSFKGVLQNSYEKFIVEWNGFRVKK